MTHLKIVRSDKSKSMKVVRSGEKVDNKTVRSVKQSRVSQPGRIIHVPYRIFSHVEAAIASLYLLRGQEATIT